MQVTSTYRYARISPFKAREVTREIQGLPASAALDIVAFSPKKVAALVAKTLKSAIANAENNHSLDVDDLIVVQAHVGKALVIRRFHPRGRGRMGRILKPFANLTIVVREVEATAS